MPGDSPNSIDWVYTSPAGLQCLCSAHAVLLSLAEYSAAQVQQMLHQPLSMTSTSAHPFRDIPLSREQHCKLLPGVADIQASQVARWTVDEVRGAKGGEGGAGVKQADCWCPLMSGKRSPAHLRLCVFWAELRLHI